MTNINVYGKLLSRYMNNMNIEEIISNLEKDVKDLEKFNFMLTPKVCPVCKKLYGDKYNTEAIFELGCCLLCDHVQGEVLENKLRK